MLADFVRERRDEVLQFARYRLAELMPERFASRAPDYLPSLLDHLIADLGEQEVKQGTSAVALVAVEHGREHQRLGIGVQLVTHDFGVLCDGIAGIAERAGAQIDAADWRRLNQALDLGIATAISSYEDLRREQERLRSAAALGSVAHELRNALASALVAFEAVKRGRVGTDSRTADIVTRNLKRSALLAANLVMESKVEAGAKVDLARLALRPIVEDVVTAMASGGVVPVRVEVDSEVRVRADKQMLISALTNLIQNAIKFTRSGGKVEVRAAAADDAVVIEVRDECGGLPPGSTETLFTPFVQRATDRTGAGLGLSIVCKIMLAHGGRVRVRDIPGHGCVFELSFPRSGALSRS